MNRSVIVALLSLFPLFAMGQPASEKSAKNEEVAKVRLKTNQGDIVLELNPKKAPGTVANFLSYVEKKHYDGTVFHRVIAGFMIQGGGFTLKNDSFAEKPTGPGIKNESSNGLKNTVGTIAMARTGDPNSATAQFFINVEDNAGLDFPNNNGYAVFGKVIAGMDVVAKIKKTPTGAKPPFSSDVPLEPVVIQSAIKE